MLIKILKDYKWCFLEKISDKTRQALINDNITGSMELLSNFIANKKDEDWTKKLKVTLHISNLQDLSLNFLVKKLLSSNNGKSFAPYPLLTYYDSPGKYLEIDVDTYKLSSAWKNGLNAARDQFDAAIYNLAFHITGSKPSQLPEQLLCVIKVNKIGWKDAEMMNQQYMDYIIQQQQGDEDDDDDLDAMYPVNMDWLLRYNWSFRIWCVRIYYGHYWMY